MNTCRRINSEWLFFKQPLSDTTTTLPAQNDSRFYPVNLPHDWLIANSADHYENSEGWYQKTISSDILPFDASSDDDWLLYFEGVYMDCTIFVNGMQAGEWKYGYSSFEVRLTPFLKTGENTILVHVRYQSPNSRWYSGAGIYRSVWLKKVPAVHIASDGIAAETHRLENGKWSLCMHTTLEKDGVQQSAKDFFASENDNKSTYLSLSFCVQTLDGTVILSEIPKDTPVTLTNIKPWDIGEPNLYKIVCTLSENGTAIQTETITTGFRTTRFDTNEGFFLNDVHIKLKGVCQHHDLGALGSAVNRSAIKRQLTILKSMGVNAVRTTHNMPAVELLELADEMGILIVDEAFDMWEMSKTTYDYARFFKEWSARDVKSWICRDRNHPCVILWSIGNEIYDTHANEHGQEITRYLKEQVLLHDPYGHALPTIGSNFMQGENARKCADILKIAGYNYAERLYNKQHADHPDWVIYGSETSSTVQSRGIYHFPLAKPLLTDDDGQCSSLGNSTVNWGAKNQQFCAVSDLHMPFSLGQFLWSGFDYIGEPTPYQSRNSFFGQIDTAGFPKDAYYFYQSVWTDAKTNPMIHILPYWDFNPGQMIDVRVYTNAPKAALFFNDTLIGEKQLAHTQEDNIIADWSLPYKKGVLTAIAYDEAGNEIARDTKHSFGDASSLRLSADRLEVPANGEELIFVTIDALDADGYPVDNATNRVHVTVDGEGLLAGLDNGDSTDYEPYKGDCRRLFSGKLLAIIAPTLNAGTITVTASSDGLKDAVLTLNTTACKNRCSDDLHIITITRDPLADAVSHATDIPVRSITLSCEDSCILTASKPSAVISAVTHPANATAQPLDWKVTNAEGVVVPYATLKQIDDTHIRILAFTDGSFFVRCSVTNGRGCTALYSMLEFKAEQIGTMNLDPYSFTVGSLYTYAEGEVANGNAHGAATGSEGTTSITYGPFDFGTFGTDTVTIPIFETESQPVDLTFIEGKTKSKPGTILCTGRYDKKMIWDQYQEETFKLSKRLKGVTTFTIQVTDRKLHIGGLTFHKLEKAWTTLAASDIDRIYGDAFCRTDNAITGIGNNVTIEYTDMDFGNETSAVIEITGRSPIAKNTIHVRTSNGKEESLNIAEFTYSEDYTTKCFPVNVLSGSQTVTLLFLPGSNFDLKSIRFIKKNN
ncbi:MAG: hypothetical protein BHV89_12465 [Clostridiales bacterium 41_21_two_genomes]|nr:MAG: hypothetical protein BHV89_12465 [Clostridiales bacterium 41_21_two_genomes]